ncbi:hypothetical protein [Isoptericola sp. NPDC060257]|uniref:hypothetical protein n=1 Tax=Isoptericola sp. NPDC060257 TaxID=3347087 RepID=UPI003662ED4A
MSDDRWSGIFLSVHDGDGGPWSCPVCDADDPTVELGQKFRKGKAATSVLYCALCTAQAEVPSVDGLGPRGAVLRAR